MRSCARPANQDLRLKTCVWRGPERFAAEGVNGLLRDKSRPSRIPKLDPSVAERVVALTMEAPPGEATHWTGAAMGAAAGVSVSSVQRIGRAHGLQPHRIRQFNLSRDPEFVDKLRDVVGLYIDPPAHAVVLSLDEKSDFALQPLHQFERDVEKITGAAGGIEHSRFAELLVKRLRALALDRAQHMIPVTAHGSMIVAITRRST